MRCKIGNKKIKKYRKQTGLDIVKACTRGNTHHRIDLFLKNGDQMQWYPGEEPKKIIFNSQAYK